MTDLRLAMLSALIRKLDDKWEADLRLYENDVISPEAFRARERRLQKKRDPLVARRTTLRYQLSTGDF